MIKEITTKTFQCDRCWKKEVMLDGDYYYKRVTFTLANTNGNTQQLQKLDLCKVCYDATYKFINNSSLDKKLGKG